jgi:gliding motility-associated-like protein
MLDITGTVKNVSCFGANTGEISAIATGGILPYSYLWTNGLTNPKIYNLTAGSYKLTVSDSMGCVDDSIFEVLQPDSAIKVSTSVTQINCSGSNNGSIIANVSGGTAPYDYAWSNGMITSSIGGLAPGTYTLTITDAVGCQQIDTVQIAGSAAPLQVSGTGTDADCLSGIAGTSTLNVSGGTAPFTYAWSNGSTAANLQGVQPGSYQVTVTDAGGCTTSYQQIINDLSVLSISANGPTEFCTGGIVTLTAPAIANANYQWYQDGAVLTDATHPTFTTPATGSYTLVVSNVCGMYTSNPINVKANSLGNYAVSPNVIICPALGERAELSASGGSLYSWNPGYGLTDSLSPTPTATPNVSTSYTVTITTNEGCSVTAEVMVSVVCDSMFVPTGFSPDGDGTNDTYVIDGLNKYPGNNIFIYNRWGNLVFKKKDYDNSFNGTSNVAGVYLGKQLPNGTYYYILDLNDGKKPQQGYITMKR